MFKKVLVSVLLVTAISESAIACPRVSGMPDYNCDGDIVITVLGDSLPSGFGDTRYNNEGGYILRTQQKFPQFEIINHGVAGQRTFELIKEVQTKLGPNDSSNFKTDIVRADVVILDIGRNDRWLFGLPIKTYRNLKRISSIIKSKTTALGEAPPLVVIADIMLPNRGSQGPWVKELNMYILKSNTLAHPADLRFDLVSKRLLSDDQIHPTSKGYDALAKVFRTYISKKLPSKLLKLRPDADVDGITDYFELNRYSTDPTLLDTDGDGKSDGAEVFELGTNPILVD